MGLREETMQRWPMSRLGEHEQWLAKVRAEGAMLVVEDDEAPAAVLLSMDRYHQLASAVISISAHLWAGAVDMAAQCGLTTEELAAVLGQDEEEFELCRGVGGISPMSEAGRRGALFIEVFRMARDYAGRERLPEWLHAENPGLGKAPVALMAEFMGLERLREHMLKLAAR